jgi:hypothetical protein
LVQAHAPSLRGVARVEVSCGDNWSLVGQNRSTRNYLSGAAFTNPDNRRRRNSCVCVEGLSRIGGKGESYMRPLRKRLEQQSKLDFAAACSTFPFCVCEPVEMIFVGNSQPLLSRSVHPVALLTGECIHSMSPRETIINGYRANRSKGRRQSLQRRLDEDREFCGPVHCA